jgi:dihydroorotase
MLDGEWPRILFKGVRLIDPKSQHDAECDVFIADGIVQEIGKGLAGSGRLRVVDGRGLWLTPGFVDLHAHLREPGEEYKEDIASASRTALASGFTTVCAMPNTQPTNDCASITEFILSRAREADGVRVLPIGAISKGLMGERLSDIGDLKKAGVVALSDDGKCVMNTRLMRRALEYAKSFDLPVVQHAEDSHLVDDGVMNEGKVSTRLGLRGRPSCAESIIVARDLELVALTGARYHVAHISTHSALDFVREAKRHGLPVTCEVTPHHLTLTDEACAHYDTATKVNPPLRDEHDREALIDALADGTIDAIATDHAPHSSVEKEVEFDCAAPGMLGFETAFPLVLNLVRAKRISPMQAIEKLTIGPARAFGLTQGFVAVGQMADLALLDPEREWRLDTSAQLSKSKNTPFADQTLQGRAMMTLVGGRVKYERDHG